MLKTSVLLAATIAPAFLVNPVRAALKWPNMPTANEIALIPECCEAKMGSRAQLRGFWNKRVGPDKFMHLHHYCHGFKQMNRHKPTLRVGAVPPHLADGHWRVRLRPEELARRFSPEGRGENQEVAGRQPAPTALTRALRCTAGGART